MKDKDEILTFERAITDTGHVLIPRTCINVNTVKAMTEQERQDMLILLEHAKEFFKRRKSILHRRKRMNKDRLKFRVWDNRNKTYSVYPYGGYALSDNGGLLWLRSDYDCVGINTEDVVIEQCTGLKDKNGELVFESDIVFINGEKWLVIWNDEDCAFFFSNLKEVYYQPIFPDLYMMTDDFKVIGNIHETPELLK